MQANFSRRLFLAGSSASVALFGHIISARADEQIEELRWALPAITDTLFIPRAWSTYCGAIMDLVQEGLLTFDDNLSLIPHAAESWKQVDDVTYTYTIRKGVTFSDGSPLTPDDVVASYNYHMDAKAGSQLAVFFSSVASVSASGENEVTVKLKGPNVQFQHTPAHMSGFIFQKKQLEENPEDIGTPEALPLGTGPYKLVEYSPAERAVLEARDDYWGAKPVAKRIVFTAIPDRQTRLLAMKNGDIDGTFDLAATDADQWRALDNTTVVTAPSLGVFMLTLDQSAPPFDDVHVRRAIAYAVDRDGLVKALLKGNGEAATALNPPEIWAGILTPDEARAFYAEIPGYNFDLEKAKAELAQSAHPNGFEVSVAGSSADPYMINILQSVSENLKQIGITVKVNEIDSNQWLAEYFRHENLGMQIMAYFPDFPDGANYPYLFFHSANAVKDGMNGSNFKNADVDKALAIANEKADPKVRAEALKEVFKIANDQVALVPVFWPASVMAINKKYKLSGYNAFWSIVPWAMRGLGNS